MLLTVVREEERVVEVKLVKTSERAARRAATAKKAAKVAAEAAKFEEKAAWQRPQKWEYEELKAPIQDDGYYSHHAYTLNRRTEGVSFIELHHKRDFVGNEIEEYFMEEHKLDVIESAILRKYEEYETLVEKYKRCKSQWDWGTYDCFEELMEDINEIEDKIYYIGEKFFDTLVPEYRDTCIELGYTPDIKVVFAEQWRYY